MILREVAWQTCLMFVGVNNVIVVGSKNCTGVKRESSSQAHAYLKMHLYTTNVDLAIIVKAIICSILSSCLTNVKMSNGTKECISMVQSCCSNPISDQKGRLEPYLNFENVWILMKLNQRSKQIIVTINYEASSHDRINMT